LIVESIKSLSPLPEDVGKLPNLVIYCVDCFSLLFSILVVLGTSPAASVSYWWIPQRGCCQGCRRNTYSYNCDYPNYRFEIRKLNSLTLLLL